MHSIPSIATYTYNAENQLTSTAGVTYTYDGDGKRVMKSSATLYWYGTNSGPLMETALNGTANYVYYFFNGQIINRREFQHSGNVVDTYVLDHLGSTSIVSGYSGAWDQSTYYPFGGERVYAGNAGNHYKFTGKERDPESGLDNFGARFNASSMGRFMSPDSTAYVKPINPQSWNLYAYARNNPLLYVDPTGNTVSLAKCQDKNKCVQVLTTAAQLPKGVTAEVDKNGNLVLKGDLSKIKGGNALRLEQLINSDKIANFSIGNDAPGPNGSTRQVNGGLSGTPSQGYSPSFSVVQPDPTQVDSRDLKDLSGVFITEDGSSSAGQIPKTDLEETAAHELLGHVWGEIIGGQSAGTEGNLREALIAEDRVRNTDPSRGLKIRHQDSGQILRETDLPRVTNPGSQP